MIAALVGLALLAFGWFAMSDADIETPATSPTGHSQSQNLPARDIALPEASDNAPVASSETDTTAGPSPVAEPIYDPAVAATVSTYDTDTLTWATAEPEDIEPFVGDTFSVRMDDGRMIDFRLREVIGGDVDPYRPESLPRSRSVTLVLDTDESVLATFTTFGARSVSAFHHALGDMDVMLGVYPTEDGGKDVEILLN